MAYAQLQNQIRQIEGAYVQLQNDFAISNNNFDILNQVHNFQTHRLQITDGKYNKWKKRAKTGPDFIWIINFPN